MRRAAMTTALTVAALVGPIAGPAAAAITPTSSGTTIAAAMASGSFTVGGTTAFVTTPPSGTPNAVSDTALASFPRDGSTYAILTSGDAQLADDPNNSGSSGASDGGGNIRGDTDYDVSILRMDFTAPASVNCASFEFRFLSEEYPEYVGSGYNDAFIAELDPTSPWTTSGSTVTAADNFAFDANGNVISINSAGAASMSSAEATGTTYDGATPLLSASTQVSAGAHSLYLSIFDQGDSSYDSAAFVDNLELFNAAQGKCQEGAQLVAPSVSKTADNTSTPPGAQNGYTITVDNPNAGPIDLDSITDTLPTGFAYVAGSTTGDVTGDPSIEGQTLSWAALEGSLVTVPGHGSISLHLGVTVASTMGEYFNQAAAQATGFEISPTGPTAPVTVTAPPASLPCDPVTLEGTSAGDTLVGGPGVDHIRGLGGRDRMDAAAGDDQLCGGDGGDYGYGRAGIDSILGDDGNDRLFGGRHGDVVDGGAGHDAILGGRGADTILAADTTKDCIVTGPGDDVVTADPGLDLVDPHGGCPAGFWL